MTTILVLCIAAAAVWVVVSVTGRTDRVPKDSVQDFSRALTALSTHPPVVPGPAARRPAPRRRPAPHARRRPARRPAARR